MTISDVKQKLIDSMQVACLLDEFKLVANDKAETLKDGSLPLYCCGFRDGSKLQVVGQNLFVKLVNQKGEQANFKEDGC